MGKVDRPDVGTKMMRIKEKPIESGELVIVDDRLESEGFLKLYEYVGGPVYLDPLQEDNMAEVAGISIARTNDAEMQVDRIFCEYGHEDLVPELVEQARHFAEFYGYSFLGLRKKTSPVVFEEG